MTSGRISLRSSLSLWERVRVRALRQGFLPPHPFPLPLGRGRFWGTMVTVFVFVWLGGARLAEAGPGEAGHEHHHGHDHGATDPHAAQMQILLKRVPAKAQKAKNPVKDTPDGRVKAIETYAKHCAVCHGDSGKGNGPAAAGLPVKPADFTDAAHQKFYSEGTMYWIVTNGWKESGMPGFAKTIPRDDRWRLVRHVLSFSHEPSPSDRREGVHQ